ncbi:PaaI family thioesterase [Altererythrobacter aquiaggeris]|uniref:PaaI family thioesterase n=1 Tax=Aestuarierythrobacter aquiaggeris TaxID=1898396 RepID=UPI00301940EB
MTTTPSLFDPSKAAILLRHGHSGWLGTQYNAHGSDWVELSLPWQEKLVGQPDTDIIASGPIIAMMDMATALAAWTRRGKFVGQATLDLRVDYTRPARPRHTVIGHGECYKLTRSAAFVRGTAHDGDPADPIAHVAGVFMTLEAPRT